MSYRIVRYPVPRSVYLSVQSLLSSLSKRQQDFVLHVLVSNILNLQKAERLNLGGWVETSVDLPVKWIRRFFTRTFKVTDLPSDVITWSNARTGQCRSYTASSTLLRAILDWNPNDAAAASLDPPVNLFDGAPFGVRSDPLYARAGSKLVRQARDMFKSCPFDYAALEQHLKMYKDRVSATPVEKRKRVRAGYRVDAHCAARLRSGCVRREDGLFTYVPEFRVQKPGRLSELGSGAQSCSREMKLALFAAVPDMRNYDVVASQAYILRDALQDAGLPNRWISDYLAEDHGAAVRAAQLSVSKTTFKRCLYATVMGSPHRKNFVPQRNKMFRAVVEGCDDDEIRAKPLLLAIYAHLAPLKLEVEAWHRYLLTPACIYRDPRRKKQHTVRNACKHRQVFAPNRAKVKDVQSAGRKAAAFILQGQEAAFIHELTRLGPKHGFVPISNQHDGLVTIGTIPDEAIELARRDSGFVSAKLEEKPDFGADVADASVVQA